MSSIYSLFVQTVDGITWKPGSTHGKKPNLYVAIHQDSAKVQRTRTVNRELAPTWDHTAKISESSTAISLRLYHDSSTPFAPNKCLGTVNTDLSTLVKLCSSDGDAQVVKLELKGVDGKLKGRPVGTISVRLKRGDEAVADQVVEPTKKDIERIGLPVTASTTMKNSGIVEQVASARGWRSVLGSVISKLEIVVRVGDEVATIHPHVNTRKLGITDRILISFILFALYAPHLMAIDPFKSVLFVTFVKEREKGLAVAGTGGVAPNEPLVWVLWTILMGGGDDGRLHFSQRRRNVSLAPDADALAKRTIMPNNASVPGTALLAPHDLAPLAAHSPTLFAALLSSPSALAAASAPARVGTVEVNMSMSMSSEDRARRREARATQQAKVRIELELELALTWLQS
ncbi:hypothetical protein FB451DRAFT_1556404 [Mycena latifolia]|nr:hypothetical protein FB451DRAFT_1556404 [Mycena latifolia]